MSKKNLKLFALHDCLTFLNKTAFLIVSDSFINMTLFPSQLGFISLNLIFFSCFDFDKISLAWIDY